MNETGNGSKCQNITFDIDILFCQLGKHFIKYNCININLIKNCKPFLLILPRGISIWILKKWSNPSFLEKSVNTVISRSYNSYQNHPISCNLNVYIFMKKEEDKSSVTAHPAKVWF